MADPTASSGSSTSFDQYTGGTSGGTSSSSSSGISSSSAANIARQKYKCGGLTWAELNPVVLGGADLLYRPAYKGSGTQVAYTPYNSARSWTTYVSLTNYEYAGAELLETDFWSSPRFRFKSTGDFAPALLLGDEIDLGFILDFKNMAGNGLSEERAEQFRDVCRRWVATHSVPTKEEAVALEQKLVDA